MSDELARFVHEALSRGHGKEDVRATLRAAGWPGDAVDKALDAYADVDFPVPVPRPRPYLSARDAFLTLVTFSALYSSAISLGALLFVLIETWIPDPSRQLFVSRGVSAIRWASSWLLITFPVFLFLSRRGYVAARQDPEKRLSRIRKWLTYLTLFVAASVLVGDLVTLVFNLLGGELGTRFLLKVISVAAIAGAVFVYYSWDLRQHEIEHDEAVGPHWPIRGLAVAATALVVLALGAGLWRAGSPGGARAERLDEGREADLVQIAWAIDRYWQEHEELPESLDRVTFERTARVGSIRDPETGEPYGYRILGAERYELCATFARPSDMEERVTGNRFWEHGAGRTCFEVDVRESWATAP